jgi:hypothetical protein
MKDADEKNPQLAVILWYFPKILQKFQQTDGNREKYQLPARVSKWMPS